MKRILVVAAVVATIMPLQTFAWDASEQPIIDKMQQDIKTLQYQNDNMALQIKSLQAICQTPSIPQTQTIASAAPADASLASRINALEIRMNSVESAVNSIQTSVMSTLQMVIKMLTK